MVYDYSSNLNPEKALIWRIVHRDNIPVDTGQRPTLRQQPSAGRKLG